MQGQVSVDTWNFTMILALVAHVECMLIVNTPFQISRAVGKLFYTKKGEHQAKQGEAFSRKGGAANGKK